MRILITYATTEGHTRKVCRFCADQLVSKGHAVELLRVEDAADVELALFDAVILAGSVHVGRLQEDLAGFAEAHAPVLNAKPTLLLVVSLSIAAKNDRDQEELDHIAKEFGTRTGWHAGQVEHVAGAFKFSEYDFFRSMAMRWIAWQQGTDVNPHKDTEYTDWSALAALMTNWSVENAPGESGRAQELTS